MSRLQDDPLAFFHRLTPEAQEHVSISYRFAHLRQPDKGSIRRLAESDHYRTDAFECVGFVKPISRCLGRLEEEQ